VEQGQSRDINRRRWQLAELEPLLDDPRSSHARILGALTAMLRVRRRQRAFHPDAGQEVVATDGRLFGVLRSSPGGRERVLCWFNFGAEPVALPHDATAQRLGTGPWHDLLAGGSSAHVTDQTMLSAYETRWLTSSDPAGSARKGLPPPPGLHGSCTRWRPSPGGLSMVQWGGSLRGAGVQQSVQVFESTRFWTWHAGCRVCNIESA
jgi:hypothetical protein